MIYAFTAGRMWIPGGALFVLEYVASAIYVIFRGVPSPVSLALGIAKTPSLINLFMLGLVAGSLSIDEAGLKGHWLPQSVFIDCIAIGNIVPAPIVIFATFVGFQGGLVHGGPGKAFAGAVIASRAVTTRTYFTPLLRQL